MTDPAQPTRAPRRRRLLSRLLAAGTILVALVAGLRLMPSSGVGVGCAEAGSPGDLELRCSFDVAAPPAAVWQAFTSTDEPRPYYFDAVLQARLEPGGRWRFVTDDRARLLAGGEVLVIDPPHRFEHTFAAADLDDRPSRITVRIEPTAEGSHVLLVHDRFATRTTTYRRFRKAHPLALAALKSMLETGALPIRARLYTAIFKPGMKLFTVRAEEWEPSSEQAPDEP